MMESETSPPVIEKLAFVTRQTGQDTLALLSRALDLGLDLLYRQTAEQAFVDDAMPREEAVAVLGPERIKEIEYAKQALAQDVAQA
jgi:hypothetical protein